VSEIISSIPSEYLFSSRMLESQLALYNHINIKPDVMLAIEIGGGNGLQGRCSAMYVGSDSLTFSTQE
jgi:hypothetical protein